MRLAEQWLWCILRSHLQRELSHRLLAVLLAGALSSCGKSEAEYQRLLEENERLKMDIEQMKLKLSDKAPGKQTDVRSDQPDLDLNIVDLWSQRFEDTPYRSKQKLSDKVIRLTAIIENVSDTAITLTGASKRFQNIHMTANLESTYATKVQEGLTAIERGMTVTLQGRFLYERMGLSAAEFVDKATGRTLNSEDLAALARPAK